MTEPNAGTGYDRRAFAEAYLMAQATAEDDVGGFTGESSAYDAALLAHRQRVLAGLQQLFGLTLEWEALHSGDRLLFVLLDNTARSCLTLRTPMTGYLVAGGTFDALDKSGDAGRRVHAFREEITRLTEESRRLHLDMMAELLGILLGDRADLTFTSADLRAVGVDDTRPASRAIPGSSRKTV